MWTIRDSQSRSIWSRSKEKAAGVSSSAPQGLLSGPSAVRLPTQKLLESAAAAWFDHAAGQVAERLNALVSKTSMAFGSSWVRIPPCPLISTLSSGMFNGCILSFEGSETWILSLS